MDVSISITVATEHGKPRKMSTCDELVKTWKSGKNVEMNISQGEVRELFLGYSR